MRPSSSHSVFAASSRLARSVVASARRKAASLCGIVTLPPRKPLSAKLRKKLAKSSGATSTGSYEPSSPCSRSQWPWISGERECLIGWPTTKALGIGMRSDCQEVERPQAREKGNEGQAENGRVVAFDPFEQMNTRTLELIAADARRNGVAGKMKVAGNRLMVEPAHGQLRAVAAFAPDLPVECDCEGGVKRVRASREPRDLHARSLAVLRLVQHLAIDREHLVGAEHHAARPTAARRERLLGRKPARQVVWTAPHDRLDRALVNARRLGLDRQPCRFDEHTACRARRSEEEGSGRQPGRDHTAMNFMRWWL